MDSSMFAKMSADLERSLKPYKDDFDKFDQIPEQGLDREEILVLMEKFKTIEVYGFI